MQPALSNALRSATVKEYRSPAARPELIALIFVTRNIAASEIARPRGEPRRGREIYRTERVNQPSIDGTRTFFQYWSVRTERRTSGTITVANHFGAWEREGLALGSLYEVSMTVEGYQSSGRANVAVVMQ
ncbi:MAG TPA: glycoside hydrolase family 11 protein [Polyangiaceae bacterium]